MEEEGLSAASTGFSAAACAGEDFGSADTCDACGARRTAVEAGSEGFGSGVFSWEGGSPAGAFSRPPGMLSPGRPVADRSHYQPPYSRFGIRLTPKHSGLEQVDLQEVPFASTAAVIA